MVRGARWSCRVRKSSIWSSRPMKAARSLLVPDVALQGRVGPQPGVAAAQGDGEALQRGWAPMALAWWASCQVAGPKRLDADVGEVGLVRHLDLGHRHDEVLGPAIARIGCRSDPRGRELGQQAVVDVDHDLDDAGTRGRPGADDGAGEHGLATDAADHVHDDHRIVDERPGGDVDDQRIDGEGVVEQEEVVRVPDHRAEQRLALGVFRGPAEGQQVVADRRRHRGQHPVDGHHQSGSGAEAGDQGMDPVRR